MEMWMGEEWIIVAEGASDLAGGFAMLHSVLFVRKPRLLEMVMTGMGIIVVVVVFEILSFLWELRVQLVLMEKNSGTGGLGLGF